MITGHEWEILAGAILVVIGQLVSSWFAGRRETGKRIGRLEEQQNIATGYRLGYREGWRDGTRERARKEHVR